MRDESMDVFKGIVHWQWSHSQDVRLSAVELGTRKYRTTCHSQTMRTIKTTFAETYCIQLYKTRTTLALTLADHHDAFESFCAPVFCDCVRNN